ncbi:IPT/TIG domain-containing protein [Kitasatospora griseola]|uniref:IPT/TIG domain-containing protein n=1 Tax=Kitasatospora griseola TaxID=2064 RepID=UPI0038104BC4
MIYIANQYGGSVTAYDPAAGTVVATVPVGTSPEFVAVSPDNAQVYVTNNHSNTVSVIDTATNIVAATIPVGQAPVRVVLSPDGAHAYVGDQGPDRMSGRVEVIDTATRKISASIQVGLAPIGVTLSPDGSSAWAADFHTDSVSVIDTATNTVSATIKVPSGNYPSDVLLSPDGSQAYVANYYGNNVTVIDTARRAIIATVPVGRQPNSLAVTPDGQHLYVTNNTDNSVSVLDVPTLTVAATVPVGATPTHVVLDPAGGTGYVVNHSENTVSVLDTATNTVTATIPAGSGPWGLALTHPVQPPVVTGIAPGHGPAGGGTTVTLTGSNLTGTSAVTFDGAPAGNLTVVNSTTVTATAPPHAPGTVAVALTASGRTVGAGQYTYDVPAPVVTGVAPGHGPSAGGNAVTVIGSNLTGALAVNFGAVPATAFTVDSDTRITATVPAASFAGAVDVTVTAPGGTSTAGRYTYDAAPGSYVFSEASDPASGSTVKTGDKVSYSVTVAQHGAGAVTGASITDDLSGVLNAAAYNGDVEATSGTAAVKDGKLTWTGDLPVGGSATITWSVTVTGRDGRLHDTVTTDDERGTCDPGKRCETDLTVSTASTPSTPGPVTPVDPSTPRAPGSLAFTGTDAATPAAIGFTLLILGGLTVAISRRRHHS